jgi:hypothetical protein
MGLPLYPDSGWVRSVDAWQGVLFCLSVVLHNGKV